MTTMQQQPGQSDEMWALIVRLKRVLGEVPVMTGDFLKVLTHPDVIEYTKTYVDSEVAR